MVYQTTNPTGRPRPDPMELVRQISEHVADAVHELNLTDGPADYNLPLHYVAQARVVALAVDGAQIDMTLEPSNPGYRARNLHITITEVDR